MEPNRPLRTRLAPPNNFARAVASSVVNVRFGSKADICAHPSRRGAPDDSEVVVSRNLSIPLGVLKQHALRTAPGQKIAYVVDAAYHEENVAA